MKKVNITINTTDGTSLYPNNFIYLVDESIELEKIQSTINEAKEVYIGDDYDDEDVMIYLVEKLGGSYSAPPCFVPDVEVCI